MPPTATIDGCPVAFERELDGRWIAAVDLPGVRAAVYGASPEAALARLEEAVCEDPRAAAPAAAALIKEAGAVVRDLARIPFDERADAFLGKVFREYAPRSGPKRLLPRRAR